ncbi:MAG TPA: hypothetical protein VE959_04465 [Bryobacteraceae bacterium]|nr:hypothetical protein [Bryobacteraceae bacterium]
MATVLILARVCSAATPTIAVVTPNSGSGSDQVFGILAEDTDGYPSIAKVSLMFTDTRCAVQAIAATGALYLMQPDGSGWIGPITAGTDGNLQNGMCQVNTAGSGLSHSSNAVNVVFSMHFFPAFSGVQSIYGEAMDNSGADSGWQLAGTWNSTSGSAPTIMGVSPASGSGTDQAFSVTVQDQSGSSDVNNVFLMFTDTRCLVEVLATSGQLYLMQPDGSGWIGPINAGSSDMLQNGMCQMNGSGSGFMASGNTVTAVFSMHFFPTMAGTQAINAAAVDNAGLTSNYQTVGSWTVPSM